MTLFGLALIDWILAIGYLALVTVIGLLASRRVNSSDSYFLGDRRFNKWLMIAQSFGTGTHAEMPVSLAGAVYTAGLSGIWFQWKNLFVTPFYWLFAPLFRRVRRTTTAEVMEDRYGRELGVIYAIFALGFFTINMASMLKGAAKVISQATGGDAPVNGLVIAMTVVFLCYSFVGGLVAAAWTDLVQGFFILTLSFLLIPLGWSEVGGIHGMRMTLAPDSFSLATPRGVGVYFIVMLTLNGLIGIMAQPHMIASVGTGKDESACRSGFLYGNFTKRFCTIGWAVIGMMVAAITARGLYGVHVLVDPEEAFGFACRHLLFPGGVGLLIASILATNMAACSAFTVDSGALFTRNLYQKYIVRSAPDRHYLLVGRISGVIITLLSVLYAVLLIGRVLYSFLLTETMATFVGVSLLGGIVWPRANRWGAVTSLVVAIAMNFGLYWIHGERLDQWEPGVFLISLLAGICALVVVSLLTRPEPELGLRSFFENLQTPSDDPVVGDVLPSKDQPINAPRPQVAASGRQLIVANLLQLRRGAGCNSFFGAYREDLSGFFTGWGIAVAMVALAWVLFRM